MATLTMRPDGGLSLHLDHDNDRQRSNRVAEALSVLDAAAAAAAELPEVLRYRRLLTQFLEADRSARELQRQIDALTIHRAALVEEAPDDMVGQVLAIDEQLADLQRQTTGAVGLLRPALEAARQKAEQLVARIVADVAATQQRDRAARRAVLIAAAEAAVGADRLRELLDIAEADRAAAEAPVNTTGVAATILGVD